MSHADKINDEIKARIEALVGHGPEGTIVYYSDSSEKAISEICRGWVNWRADLIERLAKDAVVVPGDERTWLAVDFQPLRKGVKLSEVIETLRVYAKEQERGDCLATRLNSESWLMNLSAKGLQMSDESKTELAEPYKCLNCQDVGWVCENHRNNPWAGMTNEPECCGGAGAPCDFCNPTTGRDDPPKVVWSERLSSVEGIGTMSDIKSKSDMKRRNALAGRPMDHGIAEWEARDKLALSTMRSILESLRAYRGPDASPFDEAVENSFKAGYDAGLKLCAVYQGEAKVESLPEVGAMPSDEWKLKLKALRICIEMAYEMVTNSGRYSHLDGPTLPKATLRSALSDLDDLDRLTLTPKQESLPSSFATDMCDEMENQACNHAFEKYQRVYQGVTHRQKDIFEFAWNQALDWRDQRGDWPKVFPLTTDGEIASSPESLERLNKTVIEQLQRAWRFGDKIKDDRIATLEAELAKLRVAQVKQNTAACIDGLAYDLAVLSAERAEREHE